MQSHHTISVESIRREIAERVRPACADMPEEEFETMVTRMALIEWKHFNDSTPTRRIVTPVPPQE
jgi:hypothetical protein